MTPRRAPEAVLVALAEAACKLTFSEGSSMEKACTAYRAAVAPLRTRAEVQQSKLDLAENLARGVCDHRHFMMRWSELCSEPTAAAPPKCPPYNDGLDGSRF